MMKFDIDRVNRIMQAISKADLIDFDASHYLYRNGSEYFKVTKWPAPTGNPDATALRIAVKAHTGDTEYQFTEQEFSDAVVDGHKINLFNTRHNKEFNLVLFNSCPCPVTLNQP